MKRTCCFNQTGPAGSTSVCTALIGSEVNSCLPYVPQGLLGSQRDDSSHWSGTRTLIDLQESQEIATHTLTHTHSL